MSTRNRNLSDEACSEFSALLASKQPVPGGGGAAALAGSLASALCMMVGNFTTGKKKYAAYEEDIQRMLRDAEKLRVRFLELIDADALAFEPLSRAYSIPKDDPARASKLEEATEAACSAPMEMVKTCGDLSLLLEEMLQKGSMMLISDVGCGASLCRSALECAAMNVAINTGSMTDRTKAQTMEEKIDAIMADAVPRLEQIVREVSRRIRK